MEVNKGDEKHMLVFVSSLKWEDVRILWLFIPQGVEGEEGAWGLTESPESPVGTGQAAENQDVCLSK